MAGHPDPPAPRIAAREYKRKAPTLAHRGLGNSLAGIAGRGLRQRLLRDTMPAAGSDQALTLSFSAFAMVTFTTLSAGLVIISWVCGLRT